MLKNGWMCIPVRWFEVEVKTYAGGATKKELRRVVKTPDHVVEEQEFLNLKPFPKLCADLAQGIYDVPSPTRIQRRWPAENQVVTVT